MAIIHDGPLLVNKNSLLPIICESLSKNQGRSNIGGKTCVGARSEATILLYLREIIDNPRHL